MVRAQVLLHKPHRQAPSLTQMLLQQHIMGLMRVLRMAQESMCSGEDMHGVLRLMCLLSLTQGGIAKKHFDPLRREFLQSYGHEYLLLLSKLQDAGKPAADCPASASVRQLRK